MVELTLARARLPGRDGLFDIGLADGVIAAISASDPTPAAPCRDLAGRLLLPALADGHLHLDKSFIGQPWRPHRPGETIAARIAAERAERALLGRSVKERALLLVERVIGFGTLALRSHVDIDEVIGLDHVLALLELRQDLGERVDLQLVAFPQSGVNRRVAELMEEALRLGVDLVGGLDPAGIDGDIEAQLAVLFGLAERYQRPIDIHLHDPGTLGAFELKRIAARTIAAGMQGRVAVSHAFALGQLAADEFDRTVLALAEAGVAIMSNGPATDAMPPLARLRAAGVTLFGGCDNIRDGWSPFGSGDALQRAAIIAERANWRGDDEIEAAFAMLTDGSRSVMGLPPVTLTVGSPADLIALDAGSIAEAVAGAPMPRLVLRRGRPVLG
jgi:cytosine/adenosine deaminase-related metal-dependent hydrolase